MKWGSKNIKTLQYGSKSIIAAYWGSKKVWELVSSTPEQDIDTILKSVISGENLDNMNKLLSNIESSNKDFTDINNQLEEIIGNNSVKQSAQAGDIAYWDGSSVKTTPLRLWNTSLGTPVGVVMIGAGFAPDGRARIISLTNMSYNDDEYIYWDYEGGYETDSPAPNFEYVPTTDNAGSTTTGSSTGGGYLPSDIDSFTGVTSFVDSKAKYYGYTPYIPSPYLGDAPNPIYYQEVEGGNTLSDFNGLSNTQLLVNAGNNYHAAHACWNYKDAANSNLQWYLPAMGELGYLIPRFKQINESIQAVGGIPVEGGYFFWSSSEDLWGGFGLPEYSAWSLGTDDGYVYSSGKNGSRFVRSVACL
jgi:hypothetical protein